MVFIACGQQYLCKSTDAVRSVSEAFSLAQVYCPVIGFAQ